MRLLMTQVVRSTEGLKLKVLAKVKRKKEALLIATQENGEEELTEVLAVVPRRTNYLANHTKLRFTRGGYNYFIGYLRGEFVGEENPVTGQIVTRFYAADVIRGTRHMAGNDFLASVHQLTKASRMARYRAAMDTA